MSNLGLDHKCQSCVRTNLKLNGCRGHSDVIYSILPLFCSLQFETEAEGGRLRRDVTAEGSVAPVGATSSTRTSIQSIFSGREEAFAFRRAVITLFVFRYKCHTLVSRGITKKDERKDLMPGRLGTLFIYSIPEYLPLHMFVQVSRLLEMQTPVYLQTLDCHPKNQRPGSAWWISWKVNYRLIPKWLRIID